MIVTLQGADIRSRDDLHDILARELALPDHYGRNLDALWDCLAAWIDLPLTIKWTNFPATQRALGDYAEKVLELFRQAERELPGFKVET